MAPTHNLNSPAGEMSESAVHYFQSRSGNTSEIMREEISDSVKAANTLQSVLRGEIPSAYVHLTAPVYSSSRPSSDNMVIRHKTEHGFRPYTCSSPNRTLRPSATSIGSPHSDRFSSSSHHLGNGLNLSHDHNGQHVLNDRTSPAIESRSSPFLESGSPFIGHNSSPYYSASSPHSGYSSGPDSSPYSPHRSTGSPYSPYMRAGSTPSPHGPSSPYTGSHSPHMVYASDAFSTNSQDGYEDQPIDLSRKSPQKQNNSSQNCDILSDSHDDANGSLLRNLLNLGKHGLSRSENGRDSPASDIYKPDFPVNGNTRVTLAKKMVYPITSRVSDWLLKIVQFSKSIPEFSAMSQNDKLTLLINAWTKMLLLLMAENEYEFAVTPLHSSQTSTTGNTESTPAPEEPTMKSVEKIQGFIKKCKNMSMDQKEYALMRMAVLFNSGNSGLDDPELVEKLNSAVQQLLQQHVSATRPDDVMHYSRILMLLPTLYGINCRMVEHLFCKRINTDMQVLLKEMLQNL